MRRKMSKLKKILFEQDISQRDLARSSGIHESIISMIVNGKYLPDDLQMQKISRVIGLDPEVIFR